MIVYNPRSTRFSEVKEKVIEPARKLKGWMVLKFEVEKADVIKEAERLKKVLRHDDLVVSAGGDGTATMAMNAILFSGKRAVLATLPFGNFNDFPETLGEVSFKQAIRKFETGRFGEFFPMAVFVNGKFFRFAGVYMTAGMMAESTEVFETDKNRAGLKKARNRLSFSARKLFGWYLKNKRRRDFLVELKGNEKGEVTDFVALNGTSIAGVVPAEGWTERREEFRVGGMRNRSLFRMVGKFLKSLEGELPGRDVKEEKLEFLKPATVFLHTEGEGVKLEGVKEVLVKKTGESLRVIRA